MVKVMLCGGIERHMLFSSTICQLQRVLNLVHLSFLAASPYKAHGDPPKLRCLSGAESHPPSSQLSATTGCCHITAHGLLAP